MSRPYPRGIVPPVLVPLRRRALRGLIGAQFLAETADGVVTVALPLFVLAETGSPLAMSLAAMAQMVGGAFAGVIGGILADRSDRQRVLRLSFAARAILLVGAFAAGPVVLTVVLAIAARVLGQLDNPSFDALVPAQVDGDLQEVLSLRRFIQSVSLIVGPAVGALAVWLLGERPTMLAAALLFVGAIAIHTTLHGLDREAAARRHRQHDSTWLDLARGLAVVATTPFVDRLVLWWVVSMATVSIAMAAAAVWFEDTLHAGEYWYGLSIAGYGAGAAASTLVFGGRRFRMSLPAILLVASPLYAATCALGVIADEPWLMGLGWLLWGLAMGPEIVRSDPEFVSRLAPDGLGRAYAGLGVALTLGMAVGYGVAGPLLDRFGARVTTNVTAVVILATGLLWIGPLLRREGAPVPDRAVAAPPGAATLPTTVPTNLPTNVGER